MDGIPYLAPELQLLYKAKAPRPKDHVDAAQVLGDLTGRAKQVLLERLPPATYGEPTYEISGRFPYA
jgi:hypothetical protein